MPSGLQYFRSSSLREEPQLGQDRIQGQAAVALAEDQAVAVRPVRRFRIDLQDRLVENQQGLHDGEGRAHVPAAGGDHHLGDGLARLLALERVIYLFRADESSSSRFFHGDAAAARRGRIRLLDRSRCGAPA